MAAVMTETPLLPLTENMLYNQCHGNITTNVIEIVRPRMEDNFDQFGWADFLSIVKDPPLRIPSHPIAGIINKDNENASPTISPTTSTASIYNMNILASMVAQRCATTARTSDEAAIGTPTPVDRVDGLATAKWISSPPLAGNNEARNSSTPIKASPSFYSPRRAHRASKSRNLEVQFDLIRIREHCLTVGDHDWCEGQLPLSLDWKAAAEQIYHIDDYELARRDRMPRGRLPKLDYWQRKSLLRRVAGLTELDMMHLESRRHKTTMINCYADLKRSKTVTRFSADL